MLSLRTTFKLAVLTTALATAVHGHAADNATITSSATVADPISVSVNAPMMFGKVAGSSTAGTIVLAPSAASTRTGTGGATPLGGLSVTSARVSISGPSGVAFTVTVPTTDVTLSDASSNVLLLNNITTNLPGNSDTFAGGSTDIYVGGTLNLAPNQAAGAYSGTFPISARVN